MKIPCRCGATIHDAGDALPMKGHVVPDEAWFGLMEAIDTAIETSGPTPRDKESACMRVRQLLGDVSRPAWQCAACGTIYMDDRRHELQAFVPEAGASKELFRR